MHFRFWSFQKLLAKSNNVAQVLGPEKPIVAIIDFGNILRDSGRQPVIEIFRIGIIYAHIVTSKFKIQNSTKCRNFSDDL